MELNKTYLINLDTWFTAPDGITYRAIFGTLKGIHTSENMLKVKTNARSTNWFIEIGNSVVAGCQVHTAFRTDTCDFTSCKNTWETYEGKVVISDAPSKIYNADEEYDGCKQ